MAPIYFYSFFMAAFLGSIYIWGQSWSAISAHGSLDVKEEIQIFGGSSVALTARGSLDLY
jgi:hypothetical protein